MKKDLPGKLACIHELEGQALQAPPGREINSSKFNRMKNPEFEDF